MPSLWICFKFKNQANRVSSSAEKTSEASSCPQAADAGKPQSLTMEIQYVTDRIIVALFPSDGTDAQYRTGLKEATVLLRRNHPDRYKIFNVSKKRSDLGRLHPVVELGWPQELAPPLDKLCSICKLFENWLASHEENVTVIHCRGARTRAAIVIAAYMHYINICSVGKPVSECFAMQRFVDRFLGVNGEPSHKRYITYFSTLLSGKTKINSSTIYLNQILLINFPKRCLLFKVYERMQPVYTSSLVLSKEETLVDVEALPLRGDILVKCFERTSTSERSPLFRCQFNTCTFDPSTRRGNQFIIRFYKEELDGIFNESNVDNRAAVEFIFLTEAPKNGRRRSIMNCSRADSYENFDNEEEDRNEALELASVECSDNQRPADSADSGIGSESTKDKGSMVPAPPPKPRVNLEKIKNGHYSENTRSTEQVITRAHSSLPAAVRPTVTSRSASPSEAERPTPLIEPELIAKGRYDPASKCFSYAPAEALTEHFTTPRKPMQWQRADEDGSQVLEMTATPSDISSVAVYSTDLSRRPQTPKWDDEIDKVTMEESHRGNRSQKIGHPNVNRSVSLNTAESTISSVVNTEQELEEKPIIEDPIKRITTKRKTKYGSYKTLNDESYNSDMDDLCDPEFYLTYGMEPIKVPASNYSNSKPKNVAKSPISLPNTPNYALLNGSKSVELPRKSLREYSRGRLSVDSKSPPKYATSLSDLSRDHDLFRTRNCKSATSVPSYRDRSNRLFGNDRYDSVNNAEGADDWLKNQLKKLQTKRENNPEMLRRRRQEKMLLEELKHVSDERIHTKGINERSFSTEGYGQRNDPLTEYRIMEERLNNTNSPYSERLNREDPIFLNRRVMPPKSSDIIRHKPPTPPPRARSRSPPASPFPRRSRTRTPMHETLHPAFYQQERYNPSRNEIELSSETDEGDFANLKFNLQDGRGSSMSTRSILKRRDILNTTPNSVISRQTFTPNEELSGTNRASTPQFPVRKETPLPYHPLLFSGATDGLNHYSMNNRSQSPRSLYYEQSRRTSMTSLEGDVIHHHPVFVKDTSKYWYKPTISREEAINMLRDKPPGTFVVRDSNSFPGAFGLALKVATPPPGVHAGDGTELVRHFLIEPSSKGVKLKGCNNEPVFGTLSALVYQHSITALALPITLLLPEYDPASTPEHISAAQALLQQGAACNVTYIISMDTESLTGPEAIRRCISEALELHKQNMIHPVSVHFKVSSQGVTITDNTRRLFFRRHYPVQSVTFAGIDPAERRWDNSYLNGNTSNYVKSARIFAFVARKIASRTDNACHIFAELEPEQPATAVVNFITKVMMGRKV